jgi:hypothetical protein
MNIRTFGFHAAAIDRALLGLLEERARLVAELDTPPAREPDLDELSRCSTGELPFVRLALFFEAVHLASSASETGGLS